jgi:hypothetical protein
VLVLPQLSSSLQRLPGRWQILVFFAAATWSLADTVVFYFATATWLLADVFLTSQRLPGRLRMYRWMLCHHGFTPSVGDHYADVFSFVGIVG